MITSINLKALQGQLVSIEDALEDILELDDYHDACDASGTLNAYIKKGLRIVKEKEKQEK